MGCFDLLAKFVNKDDFLEILEVNLKNMKLKAIFMDLGQKWCRRVPGPKGGGAKTHEVGPGKRSKNKLFGRRRHPKILKNHSFITKKVCV